MNKKEAKKYVAYNVAYFLLDPEWMDVQTERDELNESDTDRVKEATQEFIDELFRRAGEYLPPSELRAKKRGI